MRKPVYISDDEDEIALKTKAFNLKAAESDEDEVPFFDLGELSDDDEDDNDVVFLREVTPRNERASSVSIPSGHTARESVTIFGSTRLERGSDVELANGDFLRVKQIIRSTATNETLLKGLLMRRTKSVSDMLPKKYNELCIILTAKSGALDPTPEQCLVIRRLDEVIAIRTIILTNCDFPTHSWREQLRYFSSFHDVEEAGLLVCRWRYTEETDVTGTKVISQTLMRLREQECDKGKATSDVRMRQLWTGEKPQDTHEACGKSGSKRPAPRVDLTLDDSDDEELHEISVVATVKRKSSLGMYERRCSSIFSERFKPTPKGAVDTPKSSNDRRRKHSQRETATPMQPPAQYTYGDICAGAGGTTRGAVMAGLKLMFALDHWDRACQTLQRNFPESKILKMSIFKFCLSGETPSYLRVAVLHISFPCQPHSPVHTVPGRNDEANIATSYSAIPIIQKCRPRIVTLEQTSGIVTHRGGWHFRALIHQLTAIGYSVRWKIVNTAEYGNVQPRRRLVIIAACPGEILPPFPEPTHGIGRGLKPFTTVRNILNMIPHKEQVESHMRVSTAKEAMSYSKDIPLRQCITTNGGVGNTHPSGKRTFTLQELAGMQGFPIYHNFANSGMTDIKEQIGNAVPPVFAEKLFRSITESLRKSDRIAAAWKPEMVEID